MAPKRAATFQKRSQAAKKAAKTRKANQAKARVETAHKAKAGPSPSFRKAWKKEGGRFVKRKKGWEAELMVRPGVDPSDAIVGLSERWQERIQREKQGKAWASAQLVLTEKSLKRADTFKRSNYYTRKGGRLFGPNPMRGSRFAGMIVGAIDMARIAEEESADVAAVVLRVSWGEKPNWRRKKK